MKLLKIIASISFAVVLFSCSSNPKTEPNNENAENQPRPDSVSSFCNALALHGHRNVNMETCQDTGVLEKETQSSKMNRYPSSFSTPYIFKGKVTRYGLPIRCVAQLRNDNSWTISRCENENP